MARFLAAEQRFDGDLDLTDFTETSAPEVP
jgi:hypothetical protein